MTLPNFLICGAGKSGTTSLWAVLRQHPDIYMPQLKEPTFFAGEVTPSSSYYRGLTWYEGLFANVNGESAIGEASVAYLFDPVTPSLIKRHLGEPRLLFCLRDPAERAYSHYWQEQRRGIKLPMFDEVVVHQLSPFDRLIRSGRYGTHLSRYFAHFPAERILCLRYEHLRDNPAALYRQVCEFLGVPFRELSVDHNIRYNASTVLRSDLLERSVLRSRSLMVMVKQLLPERLHNTGRLVLQRLKRLNRKPMRYPKMSQEARARLVELFLEEIEHTERLLGWELTRWKSLQ
jgi:hypothetical protein